MQTRPRASPVMADARRQWFWATRSAMRARRASQLASWAMATRCDPSEDIDIIRRAWSGALDPRKRVGDNFNSRAIVDACRPFDWIKEFPPVAESSPELHKKTIEKWGHLLKR